MKKTGEFGIVLLVSVILVVVTVLILKEGRYYGTVVILMSTAPVITALLAGLKFTRLIPDLIFGATDTGLLTVAALVGASFFGVIGAIIGAVVGDAITDAVAGFFEGSIAEWLRSKGIEESRTALGSACGKMAGCLFGSGIVLTGAWFMGVNVMKGV